MNVDLRSFDYALEPLQRRRIWQLDAARHRLHRLESEIGRQEAEVARMHADHAMQSRHAANFIIGIADHVGYAELLQWLVRLQKLIRDGEHALDELRAQREQARKCCLERQQQLDVVERHREQCLATFITTEQRRMAAESDRSWLAQACSLNMVQRQTARARK